MQIHSSYLYGLGDPRVINALVDECVKTLEENRIIDKIDTIFYTGLSGAFVGIPLALRLNLYHCALRKEEAHSPFDIEGILGNDILIVDDMIDSGSTLDLLYEEASKMKPRSIRVLLYNSAPDPSVPFDQAPIYYVDLPEGNLFDFTTSILGD